MWRISWGIIAALVLSGCANKHQPPANARVVEKNLTVTAYCDCQKCTDWERNWLLQPVYTSGSQKGKRKKVGLTASGSMAGKGTIAADKSYSFGTRMYVPGYGWGTVEDRGGAINGNHIDIYFSSHKKALKWGRKTLPVKIYYN